MKKINYIFYLFLAFGIFSCTEADELAPEIKPKTGASVVNYIRPTNPQAADSLLVGAFLGDLIAIVGDNLHDAREMYFNDQKAILTPNYITKNTILVNVPTSVPVKVTNEILIKFADGTELKHPFKINIPGPVADNMLCEFVNDGDIAIINGDFFFTPTTVTFAGGAMGEIVGLTKNQLKVKIPTGVKPGAMAIKTNFGAVNTKFWFRDNRGTILNFDDYKGGGWRSGKLYTDKGIAGNYAKLTVGGSGKLSAAWQWSDDNLEVDLWGRSAGRPEGPLFKGDPKDLVVKFEARVNSVWHGGWMQLIFSPWANSDNSLHSNGSHARGHWAPWDPAFDGVGQPYKSDGWITASVPLSEFIYNDNRTNSSLGLKYPDQYGSLSIFVRGPLGAECAPDIDIDNFRVVPK